jgi:hypothetical protein
LIETRAAPRPLDKAICRRQFRVQDTRGDVETYFDHLCRNNDCILALKLAIVPGILTKPLFKSRALLRSIFRREAAMQQFKLYRTQRPALLKRILQASN